MSPELAASAYWLRRARRLRSRVNLAAWLSAWTPVLLASSLLGGVALIAVRRWAIGPGRPWAGLLAILAAGAAFAFFRARRSFFTVEDALTRLDATLRLHNRLVSARAGVGAWPEVPERFHDGLHWNWTRLVAPVLFCAALLAVATSVPVAARPARDAPPPDPPAAWTEMESWLDGLKERSLVEPEALRDWHQRLEELERQQSTQWFSHSSLEASDSLRQELAGSLRSLGRDMRRAEEALGSMEARPAAGRDENLDRLARELAAAASGLKDSALPLDKELLAKLETSARLRTLSAEQWAKLREMRARLKEGQGFCKAALRECREDDEECLVAVARGRPGIDRGPGTLPLTLDPKRTELATKAVQGLSNEDWRHAAPGELVGLGQSRHQVDRGAFRGPVAGGRITSPGSGGEAVWRSPTTPAEQKVLERYFK